MVEYCRANQCFGHPRKSQEESDFTQKAILSGSFGEFQIGAAVLTAPSLALRYPNNKPDSNYESISPEHLQPVHKPPLRYKILFCEQSVPVMPQQPEPLKRTPSPLNHVPPSPHCATPVYTREPLVSPEALEHPVYPGNEPPPPACKASTAFVYHYGHPPSDNTEN
ncbi:hypothetical protein POM88_026570 [Heracleum sosnowskyi]|uniref:Uncharacterized protein n=1 Tax=Heracleum sosnowskyi TaxID=360622 RepID=A0AAD8I7B7_9APIA|nr:hypothetical protein POM88_026570 [Heracleum sosnowskyi]